MLLEAVAKLAGMPSLPDRGAHQACLLTRMVDGFRLLHFNDRQLAAAVQDTMQRWYKFCWVSLTQWLRTLPGCSRCRALNPCCSTPCHQVKPADVDIAPAHADLQQLTGLQSATNSLQSAAVRDELIAAALAGNDKCPATLARLHSLLEA